MRTITDKGEIYLHIDDLSRVLDRAAGKHPKSPEGRVLRILVNQLGMARVLTANRARVAAREERMKAA